MAFDTLKSPSAGTAISLDGDRPVVPDDPIVPFIEGDGCGPEIWAATQPVLDAAVAKAYGGKRRIHWLEVLAGAKAHDRVGAWLPDDTPKAIARHHVAIKGPLETPVAGGIRSLNVALRQVLDLYACIRPVRWLEGVPSPVRHPEQVDMVVFREITEDASAGLEWKAGSPEAESLRGFLTGTLGCDVRVGAGLGIKPMSAFGSKRLVRRAIRHALDRGRSSVTLVHEGNVMKYTEGAFRDWGYEEARQGFASSTVSEDELRDKYGGERPDNKIVVKDRLANTMLQQVLLRPAEYSVIATSNLNGDYLSAALVAQVGGPGLAPSANVGDRAACFEATHGTVRKHAGQDKVNPGALILAGAMMLEHLGWNEAARLVADGLQATIKKKRVTYDLERHLQGATLLKCSELGEAVVESLGEEG